MKMLNLFVLSMCMSGCVGVDVIRTRTDVFPSQEDSHLICPDLKSVGRWQSCNPEEVISLDVLINAWGKPKVSGQENGMSYLVYNSDIAVRGLLAIFIIVPIPLVLPVGHNEITFYFKNNILTKTSIEVGGSTVAYCGFTDRFNCAYSSRVMF